MKFIMWLRRFLQLAAAVCLLLVAAPLQAGAAAHQRAQISEGEALEFKGRVQPFNYVNISAVQSGRLEALLVKRGERVAAGQALARMEGAEQADVQAAAARVEALAAEQVLRDLERNWQVERAQAQAELAALNRQAALAQDKLDGLLAKASEDRLAQARANLLLAGNQLEMARDELRKAQQKFENRKSLIWYFVNRRTFRLQLAQLESAAALAQRRYGDAHRYLDELLAPPDPIDVAVAQAALEGAQARFTDVQRRVDELQNGPDPEAMENAEARLQSARAAQLAAQEMRDELILKAPFAGVVFDVYVEAGEWLPAGQSAILLADDSAWVVEAEEVAEESASRLHPGARVVVRLDAFPGIEIAGQIEQVDLAAREEEGDVYFPVRVALLEHDPLLRWGLTARVQINP